MVDVERRRRNSTETLVIKDEHVAKKDGEEDGERQREMGMGKSNPNNRWAADSWKDEGSFSDSGTVRGTANNGKDAHSIDEGRARTQHLLSPPPSALGLLATSNTTSTTATTIVTGTTSVPCMLNQTTASSASSSTSQRFLAPPTSGTIRATKAQLKVLQKIFAENQMPSGQMHSAIADSIGMTRSTVRNWFQNQRAKTRRLQMEAQAHSQQAQVQQAHIQAAPKNNNNSRLYNYPPRADSFSDVGSNLGSNLSSFDSRYPPSHVASNVNNYAAQPIPFNLQFSSQHTASTAPTLL
ncbi:hypothetical protein HK100_002933 [Physocladia obscura]|uniref:Homeobox domain-containing protein n=1 Tax=Physocladia obscura TaxID=109957 RepID=A0AAD5XLB7_9FUNG|nr:hypothetical protein HK100_002933 [Physocladia obscura]